MVSLCALMYIHVVNQTKTYSLKKTELLKLKLAANFGLGLEISNERSRYLFVSVPKSYIFRRCILFYSVAYGSNRVRTSIRSYKNYSI